MDLGEWAICRRTVGSDRLGARPVAAAGGRLGLAGRPLGLIQAASQTGSLIRARNALWAASSTSVGMIGFDVREPVWT
jgi:hypothetical protein